MAAQRKKKRKYGRNDDLWTFGRQFTLAAITHAHELSEVCGDLIEPAWDGHRMLATRYLGDTRLAALDYRDWTQMFPQITRALTGQIRVVTTSATIREDWSAGNSHSSRTMSVADSISTLPPENRCTPSERGSA